MPNLQAIKLADNRKLEERKALEQKANQRINAQNELSKFRKMKQLFGTEGWQVLRETFLAQHAEELMMLLNEDQPLSDTELRTLRSQLQTSNRIVTLDEWVAQRVESLENKIAAAPSPTDGSPKAER